MALRKPKLIVFDLDYTLWPFWVDTHVTPPFKKVSGRITDARGSTILCYDEVPEVLRKLHTENYTLGVASRTTEDYAANQLVELFGWNKYFTYKEIFPGTKTKHFDNFRRKSGIPFEEMLFFDDEDRNIRDVRAHGVTSILVPNGVSFSVVENGLKRFAAEHN